MKKLLVFAILLISSAAMADTVSIENVIVRQRWPWSKVVDIDFTVRGGSIGVKFVAKYDGVEPFALAEKDLSGEFADILEPGLHHVAWDPAKAGLGEKELKNFTVTVEPEDKTYLILNLYDGSYRYAATEPEGGWLADPANYQTNIVFRRVPKGTFTMGYSDELISALGFSSAYARPNKARPMTISSDYYMAVFKATDGQHHFVTNAAVGIRKNVSDRKAIYAVSSYNGLRGGDNATDNINWPSTKYAVAPNSVIAAYRKVVEKTFPSEWTIDLPTSAQWVRAARGNTPDHQIWSIGGTAENTQEELTNYANRVGCWIPNAAGLSDTMQKTLGRYESNDWGFYDFNGAAFEWGIDWATGTGWYDSEVDPVGGATGSKRYRCGAYKSAKYLCWMAPGYLQDYAPSNEGCGYRLCIHLKSLFGGK